MEALADGCSAEGGTSDAEKQRPISNAGRHYYFVGVRLDADAALTSAAERSPFVGLQLGLLLGKGAYGRVYKGYYHGKVVAVKVPALAHALITLAILLFLWSCMDRCKPRLGWVCAAKYSELHSLMSRPHSGVCLLSFEQRRAQVQERPAGGRLEGHSRRFPCQDGEH